MGMNELHQLIAKLESIKQEDNQNEDAHNDLNILTQKLYNILYNEQEKGYPSLPDDAHDSAEDLIGHLGEFMARLQGDQGAFDQ